MKWPTTRKLLDAVLLHEILMVWKYGGSFWIRQMDKHMGGRDGMAWHGIEYHGMPWLLSHGPWKVLDSSRKRGVGGKRGAGEGGTEP
jgi:hypothetical protein